MKDNKEKCLIIIVVVLLLIGGLIVGLKLFNKEEDKPVLNNDKEIENKLKEDKTVSNIEFSNITLKKDGDSTEVILDIKNKNDKTIKLNKFLIKVYDKDHNLIKTLEPYSKYELKKDTVAPLIFYINDDLKDAYSLEFELPELEFVE